MRCLHTFFCLQHLLGHSVYTSSQLVVLIKVFRCLAIQDFFPPIITLKMMSLCFVGSVEANLNLKLIKYHYPTCETMKWLKI